MHAATLFFGLALSGLALAQGPPVVNTPASLITCQPAAITFSGGAPPYIISILPGGQVSAAPLFTFPPQTAAGTLTYNVVLAAGTPITLAIRDGTGALNYAQAVTILAGPDSSCVGGAAGGSSSAAATGGASSAASSASSAPASSGASTAVSASTSPRASSAASSASSAVSSASSAITSAVSSGLTATGSAASAAATATRAPASGAISYGTSFLAIAGAAALAIAA